MELLGLHLGLFETSIPLGCLLGQSCDLCVSWIHVWLPEVRCPLWFCVWIEVSLKAAEEAIAVVDLYHSVILLLDSRSCHLLRVLLAEDDVVCIHLRDHQQHPPLAWRFASNLDCQSTDGRQLEFVFRFQLDQLLVEKAGKYCFGRWKGADSLLDHLRSLRKPVRTLEHSLHEFASHNLIFEVGCDVLVQQQCIVAGLTVTNNGLGVGN